MAKEIKKLSPNKLKELAVEMFDYHENVDVFHATEDGQFFREQSLAKNHARQNDLKVVKFSRQEDPEDDNEEDTLPEGAPDKKWTVAQIREWMTSNGLPFEDGDTKAKLIEKIGKVDNNKTRQD